MKKYFFVIALLLGHCLQAFSQHPEAFKTDSIRLDSLKRILPKAKDSARVDLLNAIALRIGFIFPDAHKVDSMFYYASLAYEQSNKLGYKLGAAMALIILSGSEGIMNLPFKDEAIKE